MKKKMEERMIDVEPDVIGETEKDNILPDIRYPTAADVIEANKLVIKELRATKAEKYQILAPPEVLMTALTIFEMKAGSISKRAAHLLYELNRVHFFMSANKRTSFVVASAFLLINTGKCPVKRPEDVRFMIDVREGRKSVKAIEKWLAPKPGRAADSWKDAFRIIIDSNKEFLRALGMKEVDRNKR